MALARTLSLICVFRIFIVLNFDLFLLYQYDWVKTHYCVSAVLLESYVE